MGILGGSDIDRLDSDLVKPLINTRTDKAVNEIVEEGFSKSELVQLANDLAEDMGWKNSYAATNKDCILQILADESFRKRPKVIAGILDAIAYAGSPLFDSGEYMEILTALTGDDYFLTPRTSSGWSIFTDSRFLQAGYNYGDRYIFKALMVSINFKSIVQQDWLLGTIVSNEWVLKTPKLIEYMTNTSYANMKTRFNSANIEKYIKYNYKSYEALAFVLNTDAFFDVMCGNTGCFRAFVVCSKYTKRKYPNDSIRILFASRFKASSTMTPSSLSGLEVLTNTIAYSIITVSQPNTRLWNSEYKAASGANISESVEEDFSVFMASSFLYADGNRTVLQPVSGGGGSTFSQVIPEAGLTYNYVCIGGVRLKPDPNYPTVSLKGLSNTGNGITLKKVPDTSVATIKAEIGEV